MTTWHRCLATLLMLTPALCSLNAAEAILVCRCLPGDGQDQAGERRG